MQVSLFDAATSGIAAIDYLIADRNLVPRRGGEFYAERVLRLPNLYIHPWLAEARALAPRAAGAPVVFASFSNPTKLNGRTLETWAQVLRMVEGARLLLGHARAMDEPEIRRRFQAHFAQAGIDPARVAVRPYVADLAAHLASYDGVDVVLDPFPFNGSTSTFEALSMGVPVVSLTGDTMMSRWSGAMLAHLGLERCRAANAGDYVRIAADLAADVAWRNALRAELPDRISIRRWWMKHVGCVASNAPIAPSRAAQYLVDHDRRPRRTAPPHPCARLGRRRPRRRFRERGACFGRACR